MFDRSDTLSTSARQERDFDSTAIVIENQRLVNRWGFCNVNFILSTHSLQPQFGGGGVYIINSVEWRIMQDVSGNFMTAQNSNQLLDCMMWYAVSDLLLYFFKALYTISQLG
jgi:hypothetical protein